MARPSNIRELAPRTGRNRRTLGYTTGTGDIQEVTTYGTDYKGVAMPLQDGSTASEFSADGLTQISVKHFHNGKWAHLATIN